MNGLEAYSWACTTIVNNTESEVNLKLLSRGQLTRDIKL